MLWTLGEHTGVPIQVGDGQGVGVLAVLLLHSQVHGLRHLRSLSEPARVEVFVFFVGTHPAQLESLPSLVHRLLLLPLGRQRRPAQHLSV